MQNHRIETTDFRLGFRLSTYIYVNIFDEIWHLYNTNRAHDCTCAADLINICTLVAHRLIRFVCCLNDESHRKSHFNANISAVWSIDDLQYWKPENPGGLLLKFQIFVWSLSIQMNKISSARLFKRSSRVSNKKIYFTRPGWFFKHSFLVSNRRKIYSENSITIILNPT